MIDAKAADAALGRLEVDNLGLDAMDKRYLNCIARNYSGGPVGLIHWPQLSLNKEMS